MAASKATSPVQETDITVLKETLRSQQQLLQKLYTELDVEREAAATATNEALSMILRLQGEKAAMKMEASQYKRLAEEKISHAEESLAIFEELMYQKEMEISALEFQIEAYKYKLMSLGCDELDDFDKKFPENPFAERNYEKGAKSTMRRLSSLPSLFPTDFHKMKSSSDGKKHAVPAPETSSSIGAGNTDLRDHGLDSRRSSPRSVNSFWEQIRILDEKVKEISDCKEVGKNKLPKIKVKTVSESTSPRAKLPPKCQRIKACEDSAKKATSNSATSSNTVHDVFEVHCKFEVPESSARNKSCSNAEKNKGKSCVEEDNRLKKPDLFMIGSPVDDDSDWFSKDDCQSQKPGKKGYKLMDEMNPDPDPDYESSVEYDTDWIKMTNLQGTKHEKRSCNPSDETNDDCKSSLLTPSTGISNYQSELQLLAQRVEQLEGRRNTTREIIEGREDELNLLKQLREQLNSIQSEIRSWRPKKSSPSDEEHLLPLLEVCLSSSFQFLVANCI